VTSLPNVILAVIGLSFIGAILSDKLKVSYSTILITLGFAISLLRLSGDLVLAFPLDRTLILGVVVPPLIFESAMRTRYQVFKSVRKTVLSLAILGVIISALLTGYVMNLALGLPLAVALTFGVIVSPTDPVSVVNVLRRTRAPVKLTTILETEAYFNDATAVILYPVAISLTFDPLRSTSTFVFTLGGGLVIGLLVSGIAELLYRLITEPIAETYFTLAVMYGSYLLAEAVSASGLIAVAVAGIYMGNRTMQVAMSKDTRSTVTTFWAVLTYTVISFAFLLLGLQADASLLIANGAVILAAFAAILLARIVSVYPLTTVTGLLGEKIPHAWTKVLAGAGLRGVISVALAVSLPEGFPFKSTIVAMTLGVALLSLVIQGECVQWYLGRTRLAV
jgi:CPA1 family monovalent cation:H+ antiporter